MIRNSTNLVNLFNLKMINKLNSCINKCIVYFEKCVKYVNLFKTQIVTPNQKTAYKQLLCLAKPNGIQGQYRNKYKNKWHLYSRSFDCV